jgi:hypothetical protein
VTLSLVRLWLWTVADICTKTFVKGSCLLLTNVEATGPVFGAWIPAKPINPFSNPLPLRARSAPGGVYAVTDLFNFFYSKKRRRLGGRGNGAVQYLKKKRPYPVVVDDEVVDIMNRIHRSIR